MCIHSTKLAIIIFFVCQPVCSFAFFHWMNGKHFNVKIMEYFFVIKGNIIDLKNCDNVVS